MPRESSIRVIVKNAGLDVVGTFANLALMFASSILITRTIGADLFGKYSLAYSIFEILAIVALFDLNTGVVKLTSKYAAKQDGEAVKGTLAGGMLMTASFSAGLVLLILAVAPVLSARVFARVQGIDTVLRLLVLGLPLFAVMTVIDAYTQGLKTLKYSVLVDMFIRPSIRLAAIVLLFLAGLRLLGVILGTLVSFVASLAVAYYFARRISPFDFARTRAKNVRRELFFYSLPIVLASLMNVLVSRSNVVLVGYFTDSKSTGLFSAAVTLSPFVSLSLISFSKIFAPIISELWEKNDLAELRHIFKLVSKWIFAIGLPFFCMFLLFSPSLLLIFGPDFAGASLALRILAGGQIINALTGPVGHVLTMTGRQKLNLANSVVLAALTIVSSLFLIPRYGIAGAALSTGASLGLVNVARVIQVKILYGFTPFRRDLYKPILAGAFTCAAFYLIKRSVQWADVTHSLLLCGAFAVVYLVLVYALGVEEEKQVVLGIMRRRK